jgi:hypothetical protein
LYNRKVKKHCRRRGIKEKINNDDEEEEEEEEAMVVVVVVLKVSLLY